MHLQYTPLLLPFVGSALTTALLGVLALRRRVAGARTFAALMLALTVWTLCYVMELSSADLAGKELWLRLKYLGSGTAGPIWFVFSLQLTRGARRVPAMALAALSALVLATWMVVFVAPLRPLMWREIRLVPGYPEDQAVHGPFFWAYAVSIYLLIGSSAALFARHYRAAPALFRRQGLLLLLGAVIPLVGRATEDFLGLDLVPRLDEVVFFFLASGILFSVALFRYGALNLVPVAHEVVVRGISAGIVVLDPLGRVVEVNPYARALLRVDEARAIGAPFAELAPGWPEVAASAGREVETSVDGPGGRRDLLVQTSALGEDAGHVVVCFDITARKAAERQLAELATRDPLTGALNRRHFFALAEPEVARARRYGRALSVLMLDVDHFKRVNDVYGHGAGDQVLRDVAAACAGCARATDLFARYGGEEFVCLLPDANPDGAVATAERMRAALASLCIAGAPPEARITLSVGVAHLAVEVETLAELISHADQALYASKAAGRDRVTVWTPAAAPLPA